MLTTTRDNEEIIERVAALDIGKAELMCCVRVPDEDHPGRRLQEVQAYPALTRSVLRLADHLTRLGVTRVVMEATADYQKPVFYLLEAAGFEPWLVAHAPIFGSALGAAGAAPYRREKWRRYRP